jgi:hypothetical protein
MDGSRIQAHVLPLIGRRKAESLSVKRGQADMLSMHTATLGFIEALLVGVATKRPDETLASLRALNEAREKLRESRRNCRCLGSSLRQCEWE